MLGVAGSAVMDPWETGLVKLLTGVFTGVFGDWRLPEDLGRVREAPLGRGGAILRHAQGT